MNFFQIFKYFSLNLTQFRTKKSLIEPANTQNLTIYAPDVRVPWASTIQDYHISAHYLLPI